MEALCPVCREERPRYERAVAFGPYEGKLLELLHLLKYARVCVAANPLGARLATAMRTLAEETGREVLIVSVPLHRAKLLHRGFNQAEEIARAAHKEISKSQPGWRMASGVMVRVHPTTSQTGLSRAQRKENVRSAFVVKDAAAIKGKRILLVDDVMTTGVTADECARVLRRAGAEKVWVATVARVTRLHWGGMEARSTVQ